MASFDLRITTGASLHPLGEPTEFVSSYTATICSTDDETGEARRVGKLSALRVHAGLALDAGEPLFDVCDSHSSELNHLHALLYEPERHAFRDEVMRRYTSMATAEGRQKRSVQAWRGKRKKGLGKNLWVYCR